VRLALGRQLSGARLPGVAKPALGLTQFKTQLEQALARFASAPIRTLCAGRTDAGVHGLMQVVHFDTAIDRMSVSWVRGTNTYLPSGYCRAVGAGGAGPRSTARASAVARRYVYVILESPVRPALEAGRVGWLFQPLDGDAMQQAAACLLGTHDFSSFRASSCQALTPVKTMNRIHISRRGAYWRFEFEASAFLHHMIRNMMGCLVRVGQGAHAGVDERGAGRTVVVMPPRPPFRPTACIFRARSTNPIGACPTARLRMIGCPEHHHHHEQPVVRKATSPPLHSHPHQDLRPDTRTGC
jgi:tRNA pseudouridine38-40 synthase